MNNDYDKDTPSEPLADEEEERKIYPPEKIMSDFLYSVEEAYKQFHMLLGIIEKIQRSDPKRHQATFKEATTILQGQIEKAWLKFEDQLNGLQKENQMLILNEVRQTLDPNMPIYSKIEQRINEHPIQSFMVTLQRLNLQAHEATVAYNSLKNFHPQDLSQLITLNKESQRHLKMIKKTHQGYQKAWDRLQSGLTTLNIDDRKEAIVELKKLKLPEILQSKLMQLNIDTQHDRNNTFFARDI